MPDVYPKIEQRKRESTREKTVPQLNKLEEPSHEGSVKDNELANAC